MTKQKKKEEIVGWLLLNVMVTLTGTPLDISPAVEGVCLRLTVKTPIR